MSSFTNQSALISDRFKITDTTFPLQAIGVLTLTGQPLDTQTVTIDTKVYTFQTVLTNVNGNVLIGASASASIDNLIAAITLGSGSGTLYAAVTTLHPTISASAGAGATLDAISRLAGDQGNTIATTETLTNGSWGAVTLLGGISADEWLTFDKVNNYPNEGGDGEVIIKKLSDFPAPVAGVITLADAAKYTIKSPINLGTLRFEFSGSGDVIFQGINNRFNNITYEGTGSLFSNPTPINRLVVLEMTFISTGTGATLFTLTSDGAGNSTIFTRSTLYQGFDNFGTVTGFPIFVIKESTINGLVSGLNLINCSIQQYESAVFQGTFAGSDAHIRCLGSGTNVFFCRY